MTRYTADDLAGWTGGRWDVSPSGPVTGVSKDSRSVQQGDVYFALTGEHFDGYVFVDDALGRGAAGAVVREDWTRGTGAAPKPPPALST